MVGLGRTGGDDRVGSLLQRIGDEEFQLAGLVAAGGQAGLIVTLDKEPWPAHGFGQAGHLLQGCRQVAQFDTCRIV